MVSAVDTKKRLRKNWNTALRKIKSSVRVNGKQEKLETHS